MQDSTAVLARSKTVLYTDPIGGRWHIVAASDFTSIEFVGSIFEWVPVDGGKSLLVSAMTPDELHEFMADFNRLVHVPFTELQRKQQQLEGERARTLLTLLHQTAVGHTVEYNPRSNRFNNEVIEARNVLIVKLQSLFEKWDRYASTLPRG